MLEITKQSENEVNVCGLLNELEVVEGVTADGREYVRETAKIRADQDISGVATESEIPVKFFAMRKKKDGSNNKIYDSLLQNKEKFISVAAAEDESQASRVSITGILEENTYFGPDGTEYNGFQVSAKFLNKARPTDKEKAQFRVSGVIANMHPEEKDGEETGRLIVQLVIIGYQGKANVVSMVAAGSPAEFIEKNWSVGDTVTATGKINLNYKTIVITEEQGFGEPIERERTISNRELVITGGSPCGLDEALSYDADDIKVALANRKSNLEEQKANAGAKKTKKSASTKKEFDF